MNVRCGLCGKDIVVADGLAEGQHILCPYCNETSEYHRPSRIELPADMGRLRQGTVSQVKPDADLPEIKIKPPETPPVTERKPLRVIRKAASSTAERNEIEQGMASRRLRMAEDHVRFYEEMKDRDRRRQMREKIQGVMMLIAIVLCAVGVYWYVGYRKEKRQAAEIAFAEEKNRLEAERAEKERQEQALRAAAEQAEREKRVAEEKRRLEERQKAEKRLQEERTRAENELIASRSLYKKACVLFAEGKFDFIHALPTNAMPGHVVGEFYYLLPFLGNGEIVVCQSETNGLKSVCRLDEAGKRTPFSVDALHATLQGNDYLLAHDDQVYFHSKRKKPHVAQISKSEPVDLVKEFFGNIAPEVKRLDLDPEGLYYEIVFIPKDSKKVIIADTVDNGVPYSLAKVREAIEEAFPMRRTRSTTAKRNKKYKRSVVFWDGAHIKKGIDGVTYVPRVAPPATLDRTTATVSGPGWWYDRTWRNEAKRINRAEHAHALWQSLCEEAKKQERAEEEYYRAQEETTEALANKAKTKAETTYSDKIDRIYNEGTLYFRAKIAR